MKNVVDLGTGKSASIKGYSISGKTGTSQKIKENGIGYEKNQYVASFVGFFPSYDPKYSILVVIDSPEPEFYGSIVAAPVFKKIAQDIIHMKQIKPDRLNVKSKNFDYIRSGIESTYQ